MRLTHRSIGSNCVSARRPVSRVLSRRVAAPVDGHSSGTSVAGRLARPTRAIWRGKAPRPVARHAVLLSGLAPGGVCRAAAVTGRAVRSYRTVSPLPRQARSARGGLFSVALSLGSPPPGVTRHRLSVEPGLSSHHRGKPAAAAIRPSGTGVSWDCAAVLSTKPARIVFISKVGRRPSCSAGRKRRQNGDAGGAAAPVRVRRWPWPGRSGRSRRPRAPGRTARRLHSTSLGRRPDRDALDEQAIPSRTIRPGPACAPAPRRNGPARALRARCRGGCLMSLQRATQRIHLRQLETGDSRTRGRC